MAEQSGYRRTRWAASPSSCCASPVAPERSVFPEISANKHMIWIRFATQDGELKPDPVSRDVSFDMSLCVL